MNIKQMIKKIVKIDPRLMRKLRKIFGPFRRIGLKKSFTILSDNCWGGRLYDKFALQYLSPTIGLGISPNDFVKFVENMEFYLKKIPTPIEETQKRVNGEWGFYDCELGDIKLEFRHYKNAEVAISKWERRKRRIVQENIILKMTYSPDSMDDETLNRFLKLPYKKILFTSNKDIVNSNLSKVIRIVYIPEEKKNMEFVVSDSQLKMKEIKQIINS